MKSFGGICEHKLSILANTKFRAAKSHGITLHFLCVIVCIVCNLRLEKVVNVGPSIRQFVPSCIPPYCNALNSTKYTVLQVFRLVSLPFPKNIR